MSMQSRFRPSTIFRAGMVFLVIGIAAPSLPRLGYAVPDVVLGVLVGLSYGLAITLVVVSQRLKGGGAECRVAR